ncbi:hypothetical protein BRX37_01550 [Sphingomonas sp. S-NIH.Pt3_0716]|nr:hypothetical protein BRX37_01550 [Sphingomonas sp. S-NIH.Pt3_0716]
MIFGGTGTTNGRFQTMLPCKGRWLAAGQTEGYPPLDSVTPLHHFVVPLPLQGRKLQPLLVASRHPRCAACPLGHSLIWKPRPITPFAS